MSLKWLYSSLYLFLFFLSASASCIKIVLDPAGDAQITSRIFKNQYERNIAYSCALQIKKLIEEKSNSNGLEVQVFLTRNPGQLRNELEFSQFANMLGADFYVHIAAACKPLSTAEIFLYRLNFCDQFAMKHRQLEFIPFDEIHTQWITESEQFSKKIYNSLNQEQFQRLYHLHELLLIPAKSLIGIQAPAIMIEFVADTNNCIDNLVPLITNALYEAITL